MKKKENADLMNIMFWEYSVKYKSILKNQRQVQWTKITQPTMDFVLTSFEVLKNSILFSSQPNPIFLEKKIETNSARPYLFVFQYISFL